MERRRLACSQPKVETHGDRPLGCCLRRRDGCAESVRPVRSRHRPRRATDRRWIRRVETGQREVEPGRYAVMIARGPIDALAHLEALRIVERIPGLVGDREVGRPGGRVRAPLGAEDHELEAERAPHGRGLRPGRDQVARVIPPLGEPIVGPVVPWQLDGARILDRRGSRRRWSDRRSGCRRIGQDRAAGG